MTPDSPAWVALVAALIGIVVRLLKADRCPAPLDRIPPKARPIVAVALGQVAAALSIALVPGADVRSAITGGLMSAAVAVLGHDVIVEWLLGGKEIGKPAPEAVPYIPPVLADTGQMLPPMPSSAYPSGAVDLPEAERTTLVPAVSSIEPSAPEPPRGAL